MIVVRVELHSVITGAVTEIARAHICNTGAGSKTRGDYEGTSFRGRSGAALDRRVVSRRGTVKNHPRLEQHVWNLVAKMLAAMGYGKGASAADEPVLPLGSPEERGR